MMVVVVRLQLLCACPHVLVVTMCVWFGGWGGEGAAPVLF